MVRTISAVSAPIIRNDLQQSARRGFGHHLAEGRAAGDARRVQPADPN
jgi:hypothetical protein